MYFLDNTVHNEIIDYRSYYLICIELSVAIPVDSVSSADCVL